MRWRLNLFRRRNLWWPTWPGWICILALLATPLVVWGLVGERFLSPTKKVDAPILIVECWIGKAGLTAAVEEYESGNYTHIVAVGPKVKRGWLSEGHSVAELAGRHLLEIGIPGDQIITAIAADRDMNRTFEAAQSALRELKERQIRVPAINVFTHGTHSRRSRLVFSKVFGDTTKVGCISWVPPRDVDSGIWGSTERIESLFTETLSYFFELILNGGRGL